MIINIYYILPHMFWLTTQPSYGKLLVTYYLTKLNYSYTYYAVYNWTFLLRINHVFLNKTFFRFRHFPLQILSSTSCDQNDVYAFVSDR
jgi:hypothetical protein